MEGETLERQKEGSPGAEVGRNERVRVDGMTFEIRPSWKDNQDRHKYRLPPEKQLEKRAQRVSRNHRKASSEYRDYLDSLRTDEHAFWSLCRSVSPLKSRSREKEKPKSRLRHSKGSLDDSGLELCSRSAPGESAGVSAERRVPGPKSRGRSGGSFCPESRKTHSLPPSVGPHPERAAALEENPSLETRGEIDLYLTNIALQSSIEGYSRRLFNICRMLDADSSDDFLEDEYLGEFDDENQDWTNVGRSPSPGWGQNKVPGGEAPRRPSGPSSRTPAGKKPEVQPQVSNETVRETASRWAARLRTAAAAGGSPGPEGPGSPGPSPRRRLSRATQARLSLKERVSSMCRLSGADTSGTGPCTESQSQSLRDKNLHCSTPLANVIVTRNAHISKQPFSSLFNM
ncbi:hypothetical protein HWI79_3202 [Cryptosporidium felis]|nr:hypothetical protein HWI79_3202 [Cryptosporidium felis]